MVAPQDGMTAPRRLVTHHHMTHHRCIRFLTQHHHCIIRRRFSFSLRMPMRRNIVLDSCIPDCRRHAPLVFCIAFVFCILPVACILPMPATVFLYLPTTLPAIEHSADRMHIPSHIHHSSAQTDHETCGEGNVRHRRPRLCGHTMPCQLCQLHRRSRIHPWFHNHCDHLLTVVISVLLPSQHWAL